MIDYFDKSFADYKAGFDSQGKFWQFCFDDEELWTMLQYFMILNQNWMSIVWWWINYIGELWIGLEKLHQLTSEGNYSLHITMMDFDNKTYVAVYNQFQVIKISLWSLRI